MCKLRREVDVVLRVRLSDEEKKLYTLWFTTRQWFQRWKSDKDEGYVVLKALRLTWAKVRFLCGITYVGMSGPSLPIESINSTVRGISSADRSYSIECNSQYKVTILKYASSVCHSCSTS